MTRRPGPAALSIAALILGWSGVYAAFHGSWLGIVLPLVTTGLTGLAVIESRRLTRARSSELRRALDASAARNRERERLRRLAATLLAGTDSSRLIGEVAAAAGELLAAEGGAVLLLVEEGRFLRIAAGTGPLGPLLGALVPVDQSLVGWVVTHDQPLVSDDVGGDRRSYVVPGMPAALRTAAVVPLRSAGVVIGVLSAFNRADGRRFSDADLQLLQTLGDQVVLGLDRAVVLEDSRQNVRALAAKNVELQRATRLKSEFLANMSHELRTPLNAIIGFSDLMLSGGTGEISPQHREFLESVLRNGHHLLELINNVLDLSKIEAGRMSLSLAETDLREAITGAVADTVSLRQSKAQQCTIRLDDRPLVVLADGIRIRQTLFNLLANASKFTPEGGTIELTAVRTEAPLPVPAERASEQPRSVTRDAVWISVQDSGIGIAPEDMGKLFQEFSQVQSSANRQAQGSGLGLALSKKFVEMHGGRIGAESIVSRGSTFWFILPTQGPTRRFPLLDAE
ncbi:MAG TPA: ATP-binding protein [Gemmatimonadales bacterium]|nr:ATP-binding protein [Gemmatimonadales bacterium]